VSKELLDTAFGMRLWTIWNVWFVSIAAFLVDLIVRCGAYNRPLGVIGVMLGTYTGLVAAYRLSKADWLLVFFGTNASAL
jgi:hypothetical protein